MPTKKKTFTITEAAKKLGISRQAVHKAILNGSLRARETKIIKTEWRIPADSLKSYQVSDLHQSAGKKND